MQKITIVKPDDWHSHLRDGVILTEAVRAASRSFQRAIAMPNLTPPITKASAALKYKQEILSARPTGSSFEPIMTLYLTNETLPEDIREAKKQGVFAAKLYPSGVTTNSDKGVDSIEALYPVFEEMTEQGVLLLVHGEVNDPAVDIFDREALFIEKYLNKIAETFPQLKMVFEHITTSEAVAFVQASSENVAATVTPQHLLLNRNDLLSGGIKPHNYCLPILKRNSHQAALLKAVASGSKKFFLGTDSAPHTQSQKESSCGCAGCYTAPFALELYAQIFDGIQALDKLEGFASFYGADFYGLPRNQESVTLVKESWTVPNEIKLESGESLIPFFAGLPLSWRLLESK